MEWKNSLVWRLNACIKMWGDQEDSNWEVIEEVLDDKGQGMFK